MRTQTRSPTPCASPSRDCANASANPGSSPPWPASGTASIRNQTPGAREGTVDRAPGLSVRLKLTLSYAGFLMLAGAVLLAVGYFSLSRGVHPGVIFMVRSHADLLRAFAPAAAIVLAFLLVFGLLGGWLLAGRMLAPLTRITDATRVAANGSLSHRIRLPGHSDGFRELADAFDTMLARLEAHIAEQQRFAANASHELRTPLAITQTLLDVARNDPNRDNGELVDRLHAVNTRAIDFTEALLMLSRADQRSFTREHVDLSLIAEEAAETLLPLARACPPLARPVSCGPQPQPPRPRRSPCRPRPANRQNHPPTPPRTPPPPPPPRRRAPRQGPTPRRSAAHWQMTIKLLGTPSR